MNKGLHCACISSFERLVRRPCMDLRKAAFCCRRVVDAAAAMVLVEKTSTDRFAGAQRAMIMDSRISRDSNMVEGYTIQYQII